jgi:hypothetical protein
MLLVDVCVAYIVGAIGQGISLKGGCTYFIGGKRKETCERLKNEFESIIESLFGPFVVARALRFSRGVHLPLL